jgi:hypothetical protein
LWKSVGDATNTSGVDAVFSDARMQCPSSAAL